MEDKVLNIIKIACGYYSTDFEVFMKNYHNRKREYVQIRQFVSWFIKLNTNKSLADIGGIFGKDHATALSSISTLKNNRDTNHVIKSNTDEIVYMVQKLYPEFNNPKLPKVITEPTYTQTQILGMVKDCMGGVGVYRMLQGCEGDLSNYIKPAE